jgi:hypothetical protein
MSNTARKAKQSNTKHHHHHQQQQQQQQCQIIDQSTMLATTMRLHHTKHGSTQDCKTGMQRPKLL